MKYNADQVEQLARDIIRHKELYYAGNPEISDTAYDALEARLKKAAPQHPVLDVVGGAPIADATAQKVEHETPMLSLQKTYEFEELKRWAGDEEIFATYKVDGNSLSVIYRGGNLTLAKTRGNGRVGELSLIHI